MKKEKLGCSNCSGYGYVTRWDERKKDDVRIVVEDCPDCDGSGAVMIAVIDNRTKSKKKRLFMPGQY